MIWPWRRRSREAELNEEIAGHLAMSAHDHEAKGASPAEARYAARREFGNRTLVKEVTRRAWGGMWLEQISRDVRLAARSLRRSPGFFAIAVLALGIGLGLSTTMFSVIDAALNPEQAYANAERLYQLSPRYSVRSGMIVTPPQLFQLVRERVPALDALVPFEYHRDPIVFGDEERDQFELVTPSRWFGVVGVRPILGRTFADADGDGVAVVSYDVWRGALSGRHDLAGAHITVGDRVYSVVGVLPRVARGVGAVLPLPAATEESARLQGMPLVRLRAGTSIAEAGRELRALAALLTATYSSPEAPWGLNLVPWLEGVSRSHLDSVHVELVASALAVLLIACINLAHLMLARGVAKRRELAVRMALGAGRAGSVRVMLAEAGLVTISGVALGALLAVWGGHVLESIMPYEVSWLGRIQAQLSWRVFALGAVAAVTSALLFGALPAIRVARSVHITEPLKDEAGTTTGGRGRRYSPLVIMEVALALALLMNGTVLLRSVYHLRAEWTGTNAETLVNVEVGGVATTSVTSRGTDTVATIDWGQLLATAQHQPGIAGAALQGSSRPPGAALTAEMGADSTRVIVTQGYPVVSSNFLDVYGLPILRGRDFEPGDAVGAGVAILSAAAARRLYPKGDAVGRMLKLGAPRSAAPWIRIVGVARTPAAPWLDLVPGSTGGLPDDLPLWVVQHPGKWYHAFMLARLSSRRSSPLILLRRALRAVPGVVVVTVRPYTAARDATIAYFNFLARIFVALGAVGLGLAALGVYGVLGYAVSRRLREFGVRIALGADPAGLFRMVLHDSLVMLLAGTGVGAFLALIAAPTIGTVAVGVYPSDAVSLVVAEVVLVAVGLAAAIGPARRALRANPLTIIRAV